MKNVSLSEIAILVAATLFAMPSILSLVSGAWEHPVEECVRWETFPEVQVVARAEGDTKPVIVQKTVCAETSGRDLTAK